SGVSTPAPHVFSDGSGQSVMAITVTDNAGNVSNSAGAFSGVDQDTVAPTLTASRDGAAYAASHSGWNNTTVTVMFSASDSGSGVTNPADEVFSTEGMFTSSAQKVTDVAGNTSAPANTFAIKIDETAPSLSASITSPAMTGWYNISTGPATVTY